MILLTTDAYTKKVMELFKDPKHAGEMKDADAVGVEGNPVCGDTMKVFIKVGKNEKGEEIIEDIRYQTFGCVAAISSSEALSRIAKGKTLEEARKITPALVAKELEGLPKNKYHCSNLGAQALNKAIDAYLKKQGKVVSSRRRRKDEPDTYQTMGEASFASLRDLSLHGETPNQSSLPWSPHTNPNQESSSSLGYIKRKDLFQTSQRVNSSF